MKAIIFLLFFSFGSLILYAQTNCNNIPPVAIAGNDTTILNGQTSCTPVPLTITLNGSRSYDPDGIIVSYEWAGPGGIANPNTAITTVSGLGAGTYEFILKVTDNTAATAYDTVLITIVPPTRPLVPVQLISIGSLSQTRFGIAVGAVGNKILFAGGHLQDACASSVVDIYDVSTGIWTTSQLTQARFEIGVATLGSKILFAGGIVPLPFPGPPGQGCYFTNMVNTRTTVVDIYDASTNTWSITQLSFPQAIVGVVANNKAVLAGNEQLVWTSNNRVDIYDGGTNSWSIDSLSFTRRILAATSIGNKCYFAGGEYDPDGHTSNIDIYDASSNTWTLDYFSPPFNQGWAPSGIAVGNKNYWAGGSYYDPAIYIDVTNHVEIRDEVTHTSTFDCLFEAKSHFGIVQKNDKLVFFTSSRLEGSANKFDIYDITTNAWSIGVMPIEIRGASIISVNNTIYVAGGIVNGVLSNQVWKLEIDRCTNASSSVVTASACDTYTLNGKTYLGSGIYTQKLINAAGCDSIITLNLTINYSTHCITTASACDIFTWQGKTYTSSGFYSDTLVSSNGCDSILSLALTINNKTLTTVNAAICSGQIYDGHTTTGTYIDTLIAANGCDSIRILNLTVNSGSLSLIDTSICSGQNYAGYANTGIYIDTLVAANGCDSIRTIDLTVKNNCNIYIPNAFTPNNDGLNDLFKPTINLPFQQFSFIIFNRYGQKIFETREYGKGWDGIFKGKEQPSGSYVYRIKFTNSFGWESVENGTVLLIR